MLFFWICAALLTVLAVLAIVRPLLEQTAETVETADRLAEVAVYRDQIAEIDSDRARGLITETEAEAARIEIARRLLAAADQTDAGTHPATHAATQAGTAATEPAAAPSARAARSDTLFMLIAGAVPAVALAVYAVQGSPNLPDRPLAERLNSAPGPQAGVEELVARVEARLRANPADGQGWDVLAPVYLRLERFPDAAEAYRRALELLGESPARLSGLAESNVLANDGIVTEPARRAYQRLLTLEPNRHEAVFGLALAKEQDGDLEQAEADYRKLLEIAPPGAPWRVFVTERLNAIAARRDKPAEGGPSTQPGAAPTSPSPSAADVIAALPPDERQRMVRQMVESLSERLKETPRDSEGWQRLIRSWTVLGEPRKAEASLKDARSALTGDDSALAALDALAKNLGLKP
jgi:cytochrome c-type biogenesis protein CcmH